MSTPEPESDLPEREPLPEPPAGAPDIESLRPAAAGDPLGELPRIARRHARLGMRLRRASQALRPLFDELSAMVGTLPRPDTVDVISRASGLRRPGAIAQLGWPRLGSRIGLGIEPAIAHAVVDRLLGFERTGPEHRLQVSPVEWGVLGFVVARLLDRLGERPGVLGPWDLYVDRVGPEPFRTEGLGPIITLAWPLQVGPVSGIVRLWVPEVLVALALVDTPPESSLAVGTDEVTSRFGELSATGIVELGAIELSGGLAGLRTGLSIPISGGSSRGTPSSPRGPIMLVFGDNARRWILPAALVPDTGGSRLKILGPISRRPCPQEANPMPPSNESDVAATDTGLPAEIPVTLVIELGRLCLSLSQVADLKSGDVLELSRNGRDPVDLTSGGTLVARGELVQVDSRLGVRITRAYL